MNKYYEAGNPDVVGYPMSEDDEWWHAIDQDEDWIKEQEAILEEMNEEYVQ